MGDHHSDHHSKTARRYVVPRGILLESAEELRSLSAGVRESVVLWLGVSEAEVAWVQRIVVPHQVVGPRHFEVPLSERLNLAHELATSGQRLLVQLHTHPGGAFHSTIDDRLALPRHTGALSIVVPEFAAKWHGDLEQVSVNYHLGEGVWRELSRQTVSTLIEVRP